MITLAGEDRISEKFHISKDKFMYASGPFNLVSRGSDVPVLAVDLAQSGNNIVAWDGRSGVEISSEEYTVSIEDSGEVILFTPTEEDVNEIKLFPATYEDLKDEYSYLNFSSEEEAIRVVRGLIRQIAGSAYGVFSGGLMTDLGLVIEDNADNILGLYLINKDGTFYRENGAWVSVDQEDETEGGPNDVLESGNWIQVLDGARTVWDEMENEDSLTLADFDRYTLS